MPEPTTSHGPASAHIASGPGRVIVALYAVMALAATGRSIAQIAQYFDRAPLAYVLSAVAAVIYLIATVALVRGGPRAIRVATVSCAIELVGVLVVGVISYAAPADFPDKTVWSHFGSGYGFVPLVLPVLGLWWLLRHRPSRSRAA